MLLDNIMSQVPPSCASQSERVFNANLLYQTCIASQSELVVNAYLFYQTCIASQSERVVNAYLFYQTCIASQSERVVKRTYFTKHPKFNRLLHECSKSYSTFLLTSSCLLSREHNVFCCWNTGKALKSARHQLHVSGEIIHCLSSLTNSKIK